MDWTFKVAGAMGVAAGLLMLPSRSPGQPSRTVKSHLFDAHVMGFATGAACALLGSVAWKVYCEFPSQISQEDLTPLRFIYTFLGVSTVTQVLYVVGQRCLDYVNKKQVSHEDN